MAAQSFQTNNKSIRNSLWGKLLIFPQTTSALVNFKPVLEMKQHKLNMNQRVRAGKSALTNKAHSLTRFSGWGGFFLPQFERFPGKQRRSQIAIRINSCLRKENIFWTKPVWAASLAEILFCNTRRLSLFWEPSWQLWCIHALHTHASSSPAFAFSCKSFL